MKRVSGGYALRERRGDDGARRRGISRRSTGDSGEGYAAVLLSSVSNTRYFAVAPFFFGAAFGSVAGLRAYVAMNASVA